MTTCLTQGPGHGECYIMQNQKQLPVTTTSNNLPNNLKSNLPHSKFLDQAILGPTPEPFSTGALRCSKINHLASTPASWIPHFPKFKRLMAAFVLRTAAIACKKKLSPTSPSFTCEKCDTVNVFQCQSVSARSKPPAVNSSQMGSQASAPSSPQS